MSPLCMFVESAFALIPDHEVRAAKLTNRWISGCLWGRDALADEHLVGTKHGLLECRSVRRKPPGEQWSRRETVEARGTKWNFDVEMESGISGPPVTSRPDEGMSTATTQGEIPTVPPPAPPPVEHVPEIRGHSLSGGGDVAAACSRLAERGREIDDTGQIIVRQKLQECKNVTMLSWGHCVTSKDRYTLICAKPATLEKFWTQITKLVVVKRGEALNPRVPVTYLGLEYRSVHDGERRGFPVEPTAKYVDECFDIVQLQNAKALMTPLTEQKMTG